MDTLTPLKTSASSETTLDYHALNAMLNLYDEEGKIQFDKDRQAAKQYFLEHVNQNTVFFHNLREKLDYLVAEEWAVSAEDVLWRRTKLGLRLSAEQVAGLRDYLGA